MEGLGTPSLSVPLPLAGRLLKHFSNAAIPPPNPRGRWNQTGLEQPWYNLGKFSFPEVLGDFFPEKGVVVGDLEVDGMSKVSSVGMDQEWTHRLPSTPGPCRTNSQAEPCFGRYPSLSCGPTHPPRGHI